MPDWPSSAARHARRLAKQVIGILVLGWSTAALAGGGPEGVLLVVNPQSMASLTIANHYARLRQIPPENLLYLPWQPDAQTTDIDTFRRQILIPVLQTIEQRRLAEQIDYVIYSSDFPWGINLDSDVRKMLESLPASSLPAASPPPDGDGAAAAEKAKTAPKPEWPKVLTPVGSLNGLTYLWRAAAGGPLTYFSLRGNRYMRLPLSEQDGGASVGFRGNRHYGPKGEVVASGGQRYFLSTMLGVTAGRGNSLDEILRYLQRSAAADGTHPKGTIYLVENGDIRSKVRQQVFPIVVRELTQLGVAVEVLEGTVPLNKDDVQGLVTGTAAFDWKASGSTILPGAICEHFTSFGGVMSAGADQTPLSEFLRYGAAGASGTVTEPFAIAYKFPSPMIQVHYARGCTLAEAFYQSVYGPYQLLIVGDPLCRPWADIPQVFVTGVEPGAVVHGSLRLKPAAKVAQGTAVDAFVLVVDGRREAECPAGGTFALDTTRFPDGYHELRVVAVGPPPIESQGRQIVPVWLDNRGRKIEASLASKSPPRLDLPVTVAVRSPGSIGIVVLQGSRVVGHIPGEEGKIEIPAHTLGAGPVQLRVEGLGEGVMQTNVVAKPLEFMVQ